MILRFTYTNLLPLMMPYNSLLYIKSVCYIPINIYSFTLPWEANESYETVQPSTQNELLWSGKINAFYSILIASLITVMFDGTLPWESNVGSICGLHLLSMVHLNYMSNLQLQSYIYRHIYIYAYIFQVQGPVTPQHVYSKYIYIENI